MSFQRIIFWLLFYLLSGMLCAQQIRINEVVSSSNAGITDEDGEFADWIELYNADVLPVSLAGYHISDNADDLERWALPPIDFQPGEYLFLFASGKDRYTSLNGAAHWETVSRPGDTWRYLEPGQAPPDDWFMPEFDDSGWNQAIASFGYADGDDSTTVAQTLSLQLRFEFTIDALSTITQAVLHVDYDDAFVAYLNGVEVGRSNIGMPGLIPAYTDLANVPREAEMYQGGLPEIYPVANHEDILNTGSNTLAITVHNVNSTSSDMSILPFLTLGMSETPPQPRGLDERLEGAFQFLHTNFKIEANGETIYITDTNTEIVDSLEATPIPTDLSYGRQPDGSDTWFYFTELTPEETNNNAAGFIDFSADVTFSVLGGFYSGLQSITLSTEDEDATIYYSLDGGDPTEDSTMYDGPIQIDQTTVVRARSFKAGTLPGKTSSNTYFINEDISLPVVSVTSSPANFWDWETGIYVRGPNASEDYPYFGANFWEDWERPAHVELFETDGERVMAQDFGVQIFGAYSRAWPQKSLGFFARGDYGPNEFNYQIFPDRDVDDFKSFIMRNSGNDWARSMMRDALTHKLVMEHIDLEVMGYRPAILFLNGKYWGLQNLREKINEEYLANHHSVDPDEIDLLEFNAGIIEGNADHYLAMMDYISSNDMNDPAVYEYVGTQMDIDNYIDYQITQIYIANTDWPGNNIKYWRPQTPTGKWRWILFDTDFAFGYFWNSQVNNNTLWEAMNPSGPAWPNPPWSTFLFRKMLDNDQFTLDFIRRFADHMNITFERNRMFGIIDEMKATVDPEMPRVIDRWKDEAAEYWLPFNSFEEWEGNIDELSAFAQNRSFYQRGHIEGIFGISGQFDLSFTIEPAGSGDIQTNRMRIPEDSWTGIYFNDIPVELTAIPATGYRFVGWSGAIEGSDPSITFAGNTDSELVALFEVGTVDESDIMITEINYNSPEEAETEDWVEIYNNGEVTVDLSNWIFKDSDDEHCFVIPSDVMLEPNNYLVICTDADLFTAIHPDVDNYVGSTGFGLSGGGELIRLFNANEELIDQVEYDDADPWPMEPDGNGPTLELINTNEENSDPTNWAASVALYGTPGAINGVANGIAEQDNGRIPDRFALHQNYPNPFNPSTTMTFAIPVRSEVDLKIFDVSGRLVKSLLNREQLTPSEYEVVWDGTNDVGHRVASGVYFYRLSSSGNVSAKDRFTATRKMVLLR